jgi:fatty acid desaturase
MKAPHGAAAMPDAAPPSASEQPAPSAPEPEARIRGRIRRELPHIFAQQPQQALAMLPHALLAYGGSAAIVLLDLPWYGMLPIALVAGHAFGSTTLLAHECLHGAVVRQRWLATLLAWIGMGPLLVSPSLWRVWHNQIHHAKTNNPIKDPDHFGMLRRYQQMRSTRLVNLLAPGSGHVLSYFFLFYWLTFHTLNVLLLTSRVAPYFRRLNWPRALAETLVLAAAWSAVAIAAGPFKTLFAVLIPIALGNFVVMMYLSTNHFMRPLTISNDSLENSMSVRTWRLLDVLHFRFSHHVEHHMFPGVSSKFYPELRAWLQREVPDRYICPPLSVALRQLYATPRVYLDFDTLVDPEDTERRVDTTELARTLRNA